MSARPGPRGGYRVSGIPTAILPNMQLRQRSCPWYFRANRMECHNRRHQVTPLREEIDTARRVRGEKGHKKGHGNVPFWVLDGLT
jgi:hypothetical protein